MLATTADAVVVTEVQRRHERLLRDLGERITGRARAVAALRRRVAAATDTLDRSRRENPDFDAADVRERLRHWRLLFALVAACVLDALLAGRAGEHILRTYLGVSEDSATVLRYLLPASVIVVEMGLAQLRTRSERGAPGWWLFNGIAVLLVLTLPLIVGETELAGKGGLLGGRMTMFAATMMLLAFCIHAFVLFSGEAQHDAFSYAVYTVRASSAARAKRTWDESARRQANTAGDLFAEWVGQRDLFIARYPQARMPQPHWGAEAVTVINEALGYTAIEPPRAPAPNRNVASPAGTEPPNRPGPAPEPRPSSDTAVGPATGATADDVRDAHERRVRESEAEVVAD